MGPQGSGKGTQAGRLAPRLRLEHLSTGDLFRAAIASESPLGRRVKAILDRGDLVPDDLTIGIVAERLDRIAAERALGVGAQGALFDGFPRTLPQAEGLDRLVAERGDRIGAVVELAMPADRLVTRLAGRRVCPQCGATYHVEFNPPKEAGVCDRCGAEPVQRDDDKPEPIRRRLATYFAQTAPLLSYYRERDLVIQVDGDQPIDRVTDEIVAALARRLGAFVPASEGIADDHQETGGAR
jgi:adenylate kinase